MDKFGIYLIPAVILCILLFGIFHRVPVFDAFLEGAKEGLQTSISILPTLVGLVMAVSMFSASGALDLLSSFLTPAAAFAGIPVQALPLALIRPVSGSGATAMLAHILKSCGPDSFAGRTAAVMCGSTETTFYAVAVYYGSVGVKKTRYTIPAALAADVCVSLLSALTVRLFFYG